MRRAGVLLVLVAALASCKVASKKTPYSAVGPEAAALRDAFNADAGKVRLIVLLSPT